MKKLRSILLVDDDKVTNFLHRIIIEDMNVSQELLTAQNGREALHLLQQLCQENKCPELILLDINMPVMNGFEFLEVFAKLESQYQQALIVLMLTTSLIPAYLNNLPAIKLDVIEKPITEERLHTILQAHFSQPLAE